MNRVVHRIGWTQIGGLTGKNEESYRITLVLLEKSSLVNRTRQWQLI